MNYRVFQFFNNFAGQNAFVDAAIIFCAEYLAYALIALFLIVLFLKRNWITKRKEIILVTILATFLSRGIFTEVIRFIYPHARPFVTHPVTLLFAHENSSSFPSGHAAFYFTLAFSLWMFDRTWGVIFIIAAAIMGIARIMAGVHYPLDIIGGVGVSLLAAWVTFRLAKYLIHSSLSLNIK